MSLRNKSVDWWNTLDDAEQQRLADRHYPNDDFLDTHTNKWRIAFIYIETMCINKENLTK